MKYPKKFRELIECFESFPGIGPKTAERLAFYTINKQNQELSKKFSKSIEEAVESIHECDICGMITDSNICEMCQDETRLNTLMVVENSKDVISFEKTNAYKGKYHILKGLISPVNGIGPDDIGIDKLLSRIKKENINEIILAIPSNMEGELTSLYIKKILANDDIKIYQIGYGLPAELSVEYADEITLIKSLESKKQI